VAGAELARNDADSLAMLAHELATQVEAAVAVAEARGRAAGEAGRREREEIARERGEIVKERGEVVREKAEIVIVREGGERTMEEVKMVVEVEEDEGEAERKMNLLRGTFRRRRGSRYDDELFAEMAAEAETAGGEALPSSPKPVAPAPTPDHIRRQDAEKKWGFKPPPPSRTSSHPDSVLSTLPVANPRPGTKAAATPEHLRRQVPLRPDSPHLPDPRPATRPSATPDHLRRNIVLTGMPRSRDGSPLALSPGKTAGLPGPPHPFWFRRQDSIPTVPSSNEATPLFHASQSNEAIDGSPLNLDILVQVGSHELGADGAPLHPAHFGSMLGSPDQSVAARTYRQRRRSKSIEESACASAQVYIYPYVLSIDR